MSGQKLTILALSTVIAALTACGGGGSSNDSSGQSGASTNTGVSTSSPTINSSNARGTLQQNPPQLIAAMTVADINSNSSWRPILNLTGSPICGVNVHYIKYGTVGGAGEATNATGALMVPTGTDPACSGARPIVIYAHGTSLVKSYNIANILDSTNDAYSDSVVAAAGFAAQGFIVVAPNYAGYDTSQLPYHPYLNADQQSKEAIDALTAVRAALPNVGAIDSGKLFITGHSEGGFVTMATQRALQAAGQTVTATSASSGPYAMEAFGDAIFYGKVNQGATLFTPMVITSYQKAYNNIYSSLTDIYNPTYASGMDAVLPSTTPATTLIANGMLPMAMFNSTAPTAPVGAAASLQATLNAATIPPTLPASLASVYAAGFGSSPLVNNNARLAYLTDAIANPDGVVPTLTTGTPSAVPAYPLRQAFRLNDLRNWSSTRPTLLCGGNADPEVFFDVNTQSMSRYWSTPSPAAMTTGLLTVLDVDSSSTGINDPYASEKAVFSNLKAQVISEAVAAGATDGGASAVAANYHYPLVWSSCTVAARSFFQQVLASGQ